MNYHVMQHLSEPSSSLVPETTRPTDRRTYTFDRTAAIPAARPTRPKRRKENEKASAKADENADENADEKGKNRESKV